MDLNLPDDKMISLADEPLEQILETIIENESDEGDEDEHHHALIILDDAVNYINTNKNAMNTFRKMVMNGRHILGKFSSLMTMLVSQKIKAIPLAIRSQANSIYFFNSTRQEKEVLRDEFLPLDKQEANELYDYVFDRPHNFLFVNLSMPKNTRNFKNFNQLTLENID